MRKGSSVQGMRTTPNAYELAMMNAGAKRCDDFGRHIPGSGHVRAECPGIKATHDLRIEAARALTARQATERATAAAVAIARTTPQPDGVGGKTLFRP